MTNLNWPPAAYVIPPLISGPETVAQLVAPLRHREGVVPMKYEEASWNKEPLRAFRTISRLMELFDTINDEDRLLVHRPLGMK